MNKLRLRKLSSLELYQKINIIVVIIGLVVISSLSIGYSILSKDLNINGNITMRVPNIIRVNSIDTFSSVSGAYETYNPTYNENSITTNIVLPNLDSTATYTITIKNNTSVNKEISAITDELYNNSNIIYSLSGANVGSEIAAGETLTFTITFKYASTVTSVPDPNTLGANIKFSFEDVTVKLLDYAKNNQVVTSGDGLYNTATDTYIYKGTNPNNYLKFSGESTVYRIINYLPDGTMKLIMDDFSNQLAYDAGGNRTVAASPYCTNATSNGCNYFGTTTTASLTYTNNLAVTTDSTIKVWLDNWYNNVSFKSKIQLHDFNGGFVVYNQTPATMISQTANIIYNTYVALPGVDDFFNSFVTLPTASAGTSATYATSASYFLGMETSTQHMWLLNPSTYDNWDVWSLSMSTQFGQKRASRTSQNSVIFHVLPSFYLLSNQTFTGTGTSTDPFVIS
jgi:hypothetical protein